MRELRSGLCLMLAGLALIGFSVFLVYKRGYSAQFVACCYIPLGIVVFLLGVEALRGGSERCVCTTLDVSQYLPDWLKFLSRADCPKCGGTGRVAGRREIRMGIQLTLAGLVLFAMSFVVLYNGGKGSVAGLGLAPLGLLCLWGGVDALRGGDEDCECESNRRWAWLAMDFVADWLVTRRHAEPDTQ